MNSPVRITITNDNTTDVTEFFFVPKKVADAVKALLMECEKDNSPVVSAEYNEQKVEKAVKKAAGHKAKR